MKSLATELQVDDAVRLLDFLTYMVGINRNYSVKVVTSEHHRDIADVMMDYWTRWLLNEV